MHRHNNTYVHIKLSIIFITLQNCFRVPHWMVFPGILPTYTTCSSIYAVPVWSPTYIQASLLIWLAVDPSDMASKQPPLRLIKRRVWLQKRYGHNCYELCVIKDVQTIHTFFVYPWSKSATLTKNGAGQRACFLA